MFIGRIIEKVRSEIAIFILSRISSYKKFMNSVLVIILCYGVALTMLSNIVYFILSRAYLIKQLELVEYIVADCLSIVSMIVIYVVLECIIQFEYSFISILIIYCANTMIPINIPLAISTSKFIEIETNYIPYVLMLFTIDFISIFWFKYLIKKKEVVLC